MARVPLNSAPKRNKALIIPQIERSRGKGQRREQGPEGPCSLRGSPACRFYFGGRAAGFAERNATSANSAITATKAIHSKAGCFSVKGRESGRGW